MPTAVEINSGSTATKNTDTTVRIETDDDYEEVLIYVKFDDFDDVNFFLESENIEIKNVEGPSPTCIVDQFKFAGKHNVNLGSLLFFEKNNLEANLVTKFLGKSNMTLDFALSYIPVTPTSADPTDIVTKSKSEKSTSSSHVYKNKNKSSSSDIIMDIDETNVFDI